MGKGFTRGAFNFCEAMAIWAGRSVSISTRMFFCGMFVVLMVITAMYHKPNAPQTGPKSQGDQELARILAQEPNPSVLDHPDRTGWRPIASQSAPPPIPHIQRGDADGKIRIPAGLVTIKGSATKKVAPKTVTPTRKVATKPTNPVTKTSPKKTTKR